MRNIKYCIVLLLIFMIIGFASLSVTLSINGKANVLSDLDDFKVYFSDVKVNGEQDLTLVKNDKELVFNALIKDLGKDYTIEYDVTNASSVFDASLSVTCTEGDSLLSITNQFDTSTYLEAKSTRSGVLTLKKILTNVNENDDYYAVTCKITASAVDRTSNKDGSVLGPLTAYKYAIGTEVEMAGEKFNVISIDGDNLTLLAKYNLGPSYFQTSDASLVSFSQNGGWEYTPGPKEIDINTWSTNAKTYVNGYVDFLNSVVWDANMKGDLITLKQLRNLGCTIDNEYDVVSGLTCANSEHASWLANGQTWWTKSASTASQYDIWYVGGTGSISTIDCSVATGIRPVITVSITALENEVVPFMINGVTYQVGKPRFWKDWVASEYNTAEFTSSSSGIYSPEGYLVYGVESTDIIILNHNYKLAYLFTTNVVIEETGEIIYSRTFHTYINSTWGEWVESELNNGNIVISDDGYVVIDGYKSTFNSDEIIEEDEVYKVTVSS